MRDLRAKDTFKHADFNTLFGIINDLSILWTFLYTFLRDMAIIWFIRWANAFFLLDDGSIEFRMALQAPDVPTTFLSAKEAGRITVKT